MSLGPEAVYVVIAGSAVCAACLLRPAWVLPTFIALAWMALPAEVYGGLPSPIKLGAVLLLGLAGWRATREREVAKPVLVVVALLGLAALGATLASPEQSGVPLDWLGDLAFLFIAALAVRGVGDTDRVVIALCAVGAFLGLGAMYSVLVGPTGIFQLNGEVGADATRAAGPFGESNFFALSLAALGPLCVYLSTRGGGRRTLGIFSMCCLAGGILSAGSRGGLLAFVAGLFGAWLVLTERRRRTLLLGGLAAVALLPFFSTQISISDDRSISGRATENQIAVAMFADHPVTGVGVKAYPTLYRPYAREIGNDPRQVREPHSLPLQIAAEQGLFGIVAWLAAGVVLVGYVIARGLWRLALARALIMALAAYGVGSLFLQGSQINLLYILAGLVFALGARDAGGAPAPTPALQVSRARPT